MIFLYPVGRVKESWIREGCEEYLKRLKQVRIEEIKDVGKEKEGKIFLQKIEKTKGLVVALHETGKQFTSLQFADWLKKQEQVTFLIGSADGLAKEVLDKSSFHLSLSPFTFTHEMARLIFLEQLYRAQTILQGKSYHR